MKVNHLVFLVALLSAVAGRAQETVIPCDNGSAGAGDIQSISGTTKIAPNCNHYGG